MENISLDNNGKITYNIIPHFSEMKNDFKSIEISSDEINQNLTDSFGMNVATNLLKKLKQKK